MKLMKCLLAGAALALAGPAIAAGESCDRQCLIKLSDDYVAALVKHDPKAVPLANDIVTVENLKRIKPGEGLWGSLTGGTTDFVIHVPDPVSQQVGILAVAKGKDGFDFIGVRLKFAGGKIVEAEHLVSPKLGEVSLRNLQAPRAPLLAEVPYEYADSRGRLIWLGKSYYDALDDSNSQKSSFADDCERHENGFQTARNPMVRTTPGGNGQTDAAFSYLGGLGCAAQMDTNMWEYIDTIANRRVEIADPVTGLVWGMSHFHHDMKEDRYRLLGVPGTEYRTIRASTGAGFDMPAIHIYKVWGGKIHEIEALGIVMPYQSPTGWEE
ncbi:MAG: hypothetical protein H6R45_1253 [Proteobacteria bacterium]|nr:hypothetical protein [Pseudomonadota bacterium]